MAGAAIRLSQVQIIYTGGVNADFEAGLDAAFGADKLTSASGTDPRTVEYSNVDISVAGGKGQGHPMDLFWQIIGGIEKSGVAVTQVTLSITP